MPPSLSYLLPCCLFLFIYALQFFAKVTAFCIVPEISHGLFTTSSGSEVVSITEELEPETQVNLQCAPHYKAVGAIQATCRKDGRFDPTIGTCIRVTCKMNRNEISSKLNILNDSSTPAYKNESCSYYDSGSTLIFWCKVGYVIKANASVTCLSTGEWNMPWPVCIRREIKETVAEIQMVNVNEKVVVNVESAPDLALSSNRMLPRQRSKDSVNENSGKSTGNLDDAEYLQDFLITVTPRAKTTPGAAPLTNREFAALAVFLVVLVAFLVTVGISLTQAGYI